MMLSIENELWHAQEIKAHLYSLLNHRIWYTYTIYLELLQVLWADCILWHLFLGDKLVDKYRIDNHDTSMDGLEWNDTSKTLYY